LTLPTDLLSWLWPELRPSLCGSACANEAPVLSKTASKAEQRDVLLIYRAHRHGHGKSACAQWSERTEPLPMLAAESTQTPGLQSKVADDLFAAELFL
jgi:hypothetical protein